jgi:RNA polymerase-associated protein CTR9
MQQSKSVEAQTLLGMLYAESVFAAKITGTQSQEIQKQKDEINNQRKKAIGLLEQVRAAWKDPKKKTSVDPAILLNLARLYETESAEKSLQCLRQVEQIEMEAIPEDMRPAGIEDKEEMQQALRELLPAPLLNNMGCFLFQGDKLAEARDMFKTALKACEKTSDSNSTVDTDAFITTVSYNLGRTYEAEGLLDEAQKVYEDLLVNHSEYSDALARLAFISYQKNPEEGIQEMKAMFEGEGENLEIRALYGWFLNRTKKRTINFHEDEEQKLNKESLSMARYDTYVLTSMGNICLAIAREFRGEQNKKMKTNTYQRALELYEKALVLDPQNAYAAQGVGIAVVEEKKDLNAATQIFGSVRETMKDATVYMNLGHVYCELRQFGKAIESYEVALAKRDRVSEVAVLSSLGRVWFLKGRHEKSVSALQQSLEYSKRVQELMPGQIHFRFNVALLQVYIADLMASEQPSKRTMGGLETAAAELDEAIASFLVIAQDEKPPYPMNVIEERANHGKTRMTKIKKAIEEQQKFDEQNEQRIQAAVSQRDAERRRREEAKAELDRAAEEKRQKVLEERAAMLERDKEFAQKRAEEDALRDSDEEEKERRKRNRKSTGGRRKRRSDDIVSDGHLSSGEGGYTSPSDDEKSDENDNPDESEGEKERRIAAREERQREKEERKEKRRAERAERAKEKPRKKRKLQNAAQAKKNSKYKSDDRIVDSDEEAEMFDIGPADGASGVESGAEGDGTRSRNGRSLSRTPGADEDGDEAMTDGDESDVSARGAKARVVKKRAVVESDDE